MRTALLTTSSSAASRPEPRVAPLRVRLVAGGRPLMFIAPKLAFFGAFMLGPLIWTVFMTFQAGGILSGLRFVGLRNYDIILHDPLFWLSLRNSGVYAVLVIPVAITLSVFLAAALNQKIRFRPLFAGLLIIPTVTSTVAAAFIWSNLLYTNGGFINTVLAHFGYPGVNWLGTPQLLMPIFALLELWRGTGFYTMLFLAAMQSIPSDLYDAATVDGASRWQAFRVVTLPLMRPAILFATVMATIWNLQIFDSPYVMTRGGPGYSSMTVVMYIYFMAFKYESIGLAATMAIMLLFIIFVLTTLQLTLFRKEVQF